MNAPLPLLAAAVLAWTGAATAQGTKTEEAPVRPTAYIPPADPPGVRTATFAVG